MSSQYRRLGRWVLVTTVTGAVYLLLGGPRLHHPDAELVVAFHNEQEELEEIEFVHPYDSSTWYWRLLFRAKRTLYLAVLFTPCAVISAIAHVTDSKAWREYWLDVLVNTLELAGCSFQKFGQICSMRPDMFPPDVIEALSKLRDQVPAHEYKHTENMIMESFGHQIEDIFEAFDPVPVASGTVAQVHKARLRPEYASKAVMKDCNGKLVQDVAVKVRHPHVLDETWLDVELIFSVVNSTSLFTVPFCKEEFLNQIQKQVNFEVEAHNLMQFASNFKKEVVDGKLWFPSVSKELLSPSILIESWAPGTSVSDILSEVGDGFKQIGDNFTEEMVKKKKALAATVFDMTIKMFLRDNLVHGDLHSGNVMYDREGSSLTVIDAGLTTSIGDDIQESFRDFVYAMSTGDSQGLMDKLMEFNTNTDVLSEEKYASLKQDIDNACETWVGAEGSRAPDGSPISLGDLTGAIMFSLNRHQVVLRGDVANHIMTLGVTEGLVRSLDPDFDLVNSALPYFVKYGVRMNSSLHSGALFRPTSTEHISVSSLLFGW